MMRAKLSPVPNRVRFLMLKSNNYTQWFRTLLWKTTVIAVVGFSFAYPFFNIPRGLLPTTPVLSLKKQPLPDFQNITDITEKKITFFGYLRPEVERQNEYLSALRTIIGQINSDFVTKGQLSQVQHNQLKWLRDEYRVDDKLNLAVQLQQLISKVDIIPEALVLVQAANESAWGTSRFAQQGYNFFGLWCFRAGCGFVPKNRNHGAVHEVAKFSQLAEATYTYMRNLNRHPAYQNFREIRSQLRTQQKPITGLALSQGLEKYSERGQDYIEELQRMIRFNRALIDS